MTPGGGVPEAGLGGSLPAFVPQRFRAAFLRSAMKWDVSVLLAAYNAGPGAVSPCNCIPSYPETQAYVAKILALLGGVGAITPMPMEIELVK